MRLQMSPSPSSSKKSLESLDLQLQFGPGVDIAVAADADVAERSGQVVGLLVAQAIGADLRAAAPELDVAFGNRLEIGQIPEPRFPHERDRELEQLGVVERQNAAPLGVDIELRQLVQDQREVLLRPRIVVIPCSPEAAPRKTEV